MAKNRSPVPRIKVSNFLILLAEKQGRGSTPASAKKFLVSLEQVILDQLKFNHEISVHDLGTFYLREIGGEIKRIHDPHLGYKVDRFIAPRFQLGFTPSTLFLRAINEGDFSFTEAKKPKDKRALSKYKEVRNELRRIPKLDEKQVFCELSNEVIKKKKEFMDGKTTI